MLPEVEYKLPDAPGGCEIAPKAAVGGSQLLKISSRRLPTTEMSSWRLPDAEYKLLDSSRRRPEAPGGAKEASRRLQKRLLAYGCSEISDFKGWDCPNARVKNGGAEASGEGGGVISFK